MFRKVIIVLFALTIFSGCSTAKKLEVVSQPVDRVPLTIYDPQKLHLKDVKFVIITRENAEEVFNELEEKGLYPVLFGLSGRDYKALAINMDEIKAFMIKQKFIIDAYRSYYEGQQK